jgi:Uma2 family endonuclease
MGECAFRLCEDRARTGLRVLISIRLRVANNVVRVADVAVFEHEPAEEVPATPPLVAVEILSPDDRVGYILPKLEEYRQRGVRHIWVADPEDRKVFTYGDAGLHEVTELALPGHAIVLTLTDIFGET